MPLGITNPKDFEDEKSKLGIEDWVQEELKRAEIISISRGRGDKSETPEIIRNIISEKAITEGKTAAIAKQFGVSKSSVDAYKNGATSTASYNKPDDKLAKANNDVREVIRNQARTKLLDALNEITPSKIAGAKIRDIASITKDLSSVVKDMDIDSQDKSGSNGPKIMIYAPRLRSEEEFEVITVNE
jgi:hypothetical protein